MNSKIVIILLSVLLLIAVGTIAFLTIDFSQFTKPLNKLTQALPSTCNEQRVIEKAKSCTVLIETENGHGSGFSIGNGYIITNRHVIEGARDIKMYSPDESDVVVWNYSSEEDDLAVLKTDKNIPACSWADSDKISLAQTLYTVGWPNDPEGDSSLTKGIFSRAIKAYQGPQFIQTDAAVNPGNSGGPLVDKCGVVGINSAKIVWATEDIPTEGFSFAISSNYAQKITNELIANGSEKQEVVQEQSIDPYLTEDNAQSLVNEVGTIYNLPEGEMPTIATVTDVGLLSDQEFFANARNGDRVLIFEASQMAILYRPSTKKIIEVGPVNMNQ